MNCSWCTIYEVRVEYKKRQAIWQHRLVSSRYSIKKTSRSELQVKVLGRLQPNGRRPLVVTTMVALQRCTLFQMLLHHVTTSSLVSLTLRGHHMSKPCFQEQKSKETHLAEENTLSANLYFLTPAQCRKARIGRFNLQCGTSAQ